MLAHPWQDLVAALRPFPPQPIGGSRGSPAQAGTTNLGDVTLLTEEEITTALGTLRGWARSGDSITATVELADFREAMLYTGAVAYLAETANHHPDILIQWNRVTLTLSTHSEGGLTAADMALAGRISVLR